MYQPPGHGTNLIEELDSFACLYERPGVTMPRSHNDRFQAATLPDSDAGSVTDTVTGTVTATDTVTVPCPGRCPCHGRCRCLRARGREREREGTATRRVSSTD
jgi:hypothetical protein